ncbi:hypothetical protein JIN85_06480 [Luteolibacter pohnpeiensis]|uniref:Uncharacterized protein n=1 Tax=Luteolibacter pohnpeiensis TaxID=454153 RepID=A0A934VVQ9_9BACT|nr:hypothetical protein [Luteolibacter pohnpeiensis]MBK1882053.1 hypothetical protein [Luteolibacter pohnpeiensis]
MIKTLAFLCLTATQLLANPDLFRERFADPVTREASLSMLTPGSRDFFFYQALHFQLTGNQSEFARTIKDWKTASSRKDNPVSQKGLGDLENRQLVLNYTDDPDKALPKLVEKLGLKFNDTPPETISAAPESPTQVDPAWITTSSFEKIASTKNPDKPYLTYVKQRLYQELENAADFDEAEALWFALKIDRPDLPGFMKLLDRLLALERPPIFHNLPCSSQLSHDQLKQLAQSHPTLLADESFTIAYLTSMRPNSTVDLERDLKARAAHLQACLEFTKSLPPALNSLKLHVLYHHLLLQEELGNYPKAEFLDYLAIPRTNHPFILTDKNRQQTSSPNLTKDYLQATGCHPVQNDEEMVTRLLQHFLAQSSDASDFAPYIESSQLKHLQTVAQLLHSADPAVWGAGLTPEELDQLKNRVTLSFAPQTPQILGSDDSVILPLKLKNTPSVLVRIFEINLPDYLKSHQSRPDLTINLDGMIPHHERQLKFDQPSIQLHREELELPELAGPGTWVVELVSNGVSSRALIQKGSITPLLDRTAESQSIRIYNEKNEPIMDGLLDLGSEKIQADEAGVIVIPDSLQQAVDQGTLIAGKLAVPIKLGDRTDQVALNMGIHLEREQLIAERQAELLLRLQLTNHGIEIPLTRLSQVSVTLNATLLGNTVTQRVIGKDLKLAPSLSIPFHVPANLQSLSITLQGSYQSPLGGEPVVLSSTSSYELNHSLLNDQIATVFFAPTTSGHQLEIRGRNGEPIPSRSFNLTLFHSGYSQPFEAACRTDENGIFMLGDLDQIVEARVSGTDLAETHYDPSRRITDVPDSIDCISGETIRLPNILGLTKTNRLQLSLIETTSSDSALSDHFDQISIDANFLVITGLKAGSYRLLQKDSKTALHVYDGVRRDDHIFTKNSIVPVGNSAVPMVESETRDGDDLLIRINNNTATTRVTVVGHRYAFPEWFPGRGAIPFEAANRTETKVGYWPCGYRTGVKVGDEMRYILERRGATKFPGSMLPRPGTLLHRWPDEEAVQDEQDVLLGGGGRSLSRASQEPYSPPPLPMVDSSDGTTMGSSSENCDFLAHPAVVRFDLTPDENGIIRLPIADFKNSQFIEIIAADSSGSDRLKVSLEPSAPELRDQRLIRGLDPATPYVARHSAAALFKDSEATIENLLDADWRAFNTLEDAHQFLIGMTADRNLAEFRFLTKWPDLTEEDKLELLAKYQCHELDLFIARKDKPFFERYLKPMLAAKPQPEFIDDLLLQRDLSPYLRPYAWNRLNAAEKALLAQALPEARDRIARELKLRWDAEAPPPEQQTQLFTQTLQGTDLAVIDTLGLAKNDDVDPFGLAEYDSYSAGSPLLTDKLRRIIIPRIDFNDITFREAVDFLRLRAVELDSTELDPSKKGINMMIDQGQASATDFAQRRISDLHLSNIPLETALNYICEATGMRYKTDDFSVKLVPQTGAGKDMASRTFTVSPDFANKLYGPSLQAGDPFAGLSLDPALSARPSITELLEGSGVRFPEGSKATLTPNGKLIVIAPPSELEKIDRLTESYGEADIEGYFYAPSEADDPFGWQPQITYSKTQIWRESNYYRHRGNTGETFIPLNQFWVDLAAWDGNGPFLSPNFNACHTNGNEALMCLALLDLPFKAEQPEIVSENNTMRVKARAPMVLFYKDTVAVPQANEDSPLLTRQSFYPLHQPTRRVDGQEISNDVSGEFKTGTAYGISLVVTNTSGFGHQIDLLAQIPTGAIPLAGQPETLSISKKIQPFGVINLNLAFYFPSEGTYSICPFGISENGKLLARTSPQQLVVNGNPSDLATNDWRGIAANGSPEQVYSYLRNAPLEGLEIDRILWRLKDQKVYQQIASILRDRMLFSSNVFAYAFLHRDEQGISDYLENSDLIHHLGDWLDSSLLQLRPQIHLNWSQLEFDPVVNPRSHFFSDNPRLTHDLALKYYRDFLDQLAWKPELSAEDRLNLCALLFLQDRIGEAIAEFDQIDPSGLGSRLQYDFLKATSLFYRGQPGEASAIAKTYLSSLPPGIWKDRYQAVVNQTTEITVLFQNSELPGETEEEPAQELQLTSDTSGGLLLKHHGFSKATLDYFQVDLEVLFSANPFLEGDRDSNEPPMIPNHTAEIALTDAESTTAIEVPENLASGNLLVVAKSGDATSMQILDDSPVIVRNQAAARTLQLFDRETTKPVSKVYVKVYAEDQSGEISFHKDGYTDLRGKFDYLTHTGKDISTIRRVAVLIISPEHHIARTMIFER